MILITEFMDTKAIAWLEERSDVVCDPDLYRQADRLAELMPLAKGLIVRNRTHVSENLISTAPHLQVVGRLGVGLDNLELDALAARGVAAVYAPGANANAVAEYTMAVMLAHTKRLLLADSSVRQGRWERERYTGSEVRGKIVGIVGLGAVGKRLAELCLAMGCRVVVHTKPEQSGYEAVSLDQLLMQADFVSLNLPLTSATKGLIGERELNMMKPSAYLINTARGGIVDEAALYSALQAGKIAGATLDVRVHEPPLKDDPMARLENVILTPHLAGLTDEAQQAVCQMVAEDVWSVLQGEEPLHPVP
ncbi:MAG: hydroxyacid dehydrogenase [Bacillota bacterium]